MIILNYFIKMYFLLQLMSEQTAKEQITGVETHTSIHFIKHLFRYINCLYKDPQSKHIKFEKDIEKIKITV